MASWTDQPIQFTPFVQTLPLEAMLAVGMEKQRRYDENIRRIQSNVDRVAGLDVVRDVDKKYLKSKLNDLGTRLRTVAAGDFSNYQLTNHVAGMATNIGRDENIINAVSSTAFYRKQIEQMQKDNQEGKGNPANNARFEREASKWLNSSELGQTFSSGYIPPIDVWSKLKDIAKEVGIDEQTVQELFRKDEQGNIVYRDIIDPVTGEVKGKEPIWEPLMLEKTLKGKDAGKILSAFETALTSADYQQLAIEGEYTKGSYTPDMLKKEINTNYKEQREFVNDKIQSIKIALVQENSKNDKDTERIGSLTKQLDYFEKSQSKLNNSIQRDLSLVDSNPDAVRASLYTNNYLHTMAKNLSSQDVSIKYSVNPLHTITKDQNEYNLSLRREDRMEREFQYKMASEAAKAGGGAGSDIRMPIDVTSPSMIKDRIEGEYDEMLQSRTSMDYMIASEYYKRTNSRNPNETLPEYEARIRSKITEDAGENVDDYVSKIADLQLTEWNTGTGDNIPAEYQDLLNERHELTKRIDIRKRQIEGVKQESLQEARARGLSIISDDELKQGLKSKTLNIKTHVFGGSEFNITLSPQNIVDLAYAAPGVFKSEARKEKQEQARQRLVRDLGENYKLITDRVYSSIASGVYTGINDPDVAKVASMINYSDAKELSKIEGQKYIDKGYIEQPIMTPLKRGKDNKEDFNSGVSAIISKYKENEAHKYDMQEMQKIFLSDTDATVHVEAHPIGGKSRYEMVVKSSETGEEHRMVIDNQDYKVLTGRDAPVSASKPAIVEKLEESGTTNLYGMDSPATAYFQSINFSSLNKYKASADFVKDAFNPNIVWMKIYVYEGGKMIDELTFPDRRDTKTKLYIRDPRSGEYNSNLESFPSQFTDNDIEILRRKRE